MVALTSVEFKLKFSCFLTPVLHCSFILEFTIKGIHISKWKQGLEHCRVFCRIVSFLTVLFAIFKAIELQYDWVIRQNLVMFRYCFRSLHSQDCSSCIAQGPWLHFCSIFLWTYHRITEEFRRDLLRSSNTMLSLMDKCL